MADIKLNDNLRRLLSERNITQKELGNYLGIKGGRISSYVRGIDTPRLERACKIADYFNISLDELIVGKKVKRNTNREIRTKKNISILKDKKGLSNEKLAEKAGVSWTNLYSKVNRSHRSDTIALLAEALEVSIEELVYGEVE